MDDAQQLLLWRWSTIVQMSSMAMVAAFFALLARANPRPELRWWKRAWLANLVALTVTAIYWVAQTDAGFPLVVLVYTGAKAAFILMLFNGVWTLGRPGVRLFDRQMMVILITAYALLSAIFLHDLFMVGIVQHTLMGVLLIGFAVLLWRATVDGVTWLVGGFIVRGVIALAEGAAYVIQVSGDAGVLASWAQPIGGFLAASSSFDAGAEWLMVLGCVLAVSERGKHALEASNHRLMLAQEDLRRLADRDPLTGAVNRRALRDIFTVVQQSGAMLLFFDLNEFKRINDVHGHASGDGCLQLFAAALKESFRPSDHVIRYGGDEFLVIAQGLDATAARARVEDVTARMKRGEPRGWCGFSVGMSALEPGGQPEQAMQFADENMYKAKHSR